MNNSYVKLIVFYLFKACPDKRIGETNDGKVLCAQRKHFRIVGKQKKKCLWHNGAQNAKTPANHLSADQGQSKCTPYAWQILATPKLRGKRSCGTGDPKDKDQEDKGDLAGLHQTGQSVVPQ